MILHWFEHWEPIWLFVILAIETWVGLLSLIWLRREYFYDKEKDDSRKQRKTKTTKKTTKNASGESTVEESVEVTEPTQEAK
jgi:hypothetical protein